jgi:hypothetical protein
MEAVQKTDVKGPVKEVMGPRVTVTVDGTGMSSQEAPFQWIILAPFTLQQSLALTQKIDENPSVSFSVLHEAPFQ